MEQEIRSRPHHELQLLPSFASHQNQSSWPSSASASDHKQLLHPPVSLDLQLSISLTTPLPAPAATKLPAKGNRSAEGMTKWNAAEQIRLAAMEKAYAERVRELARKEMELAQNELARASHVWESAREEVKRVERLKARSVVAEEGGGTCMEITCHCCRRRFVRPSV